MFRRTVFLFLLCAAAVCGFAQSPYPRLCSYSCPVVATCERANDSFLQCSRRCYVPGTNCRTWYVQCWIEHDEMGTVGRCGESGPWTYSGGGTNADALQECADVDPMTGECLSSPIIIDHAGDGLQLTGPEDGVEFDLDANGFPERTAWTMANGDDGWLALDRDGNGSIDNGGELFGDNTTQPDASARNGYLALGQFDLDANGVIDPRDAVWSQLVVWRDADHDGRSSPTELVSLDDLQILGLELTYRENGRRDQHGNFLRYKAKVLSEKHATTARWSYDVFLRVVR